MKKLLLISILILIIFSSGCTFPSPIEDDIIVIKSLESIPSTVSPGQNIKLVSYVQNLGTDSKKVALELYDFEEFFNLSGNAIQNIALAAHEIKEVVWVLTAKEIPLATEAELKISARYNQTTTSLTTVQFIGYTEMQKQIADSSFSKTSSNIESSEGPVKAYIKIKDNQPIPVTGEKTLINAELNVENKGYGFVPNKTIEKDKIKIFFQNNQIHIDDDIIFIEKKIPTIPLKIKADTKGIEKTITNHITTKIEYSYEVRKTAKVKITP